ncbi:MAG: hypothetical protein OEY17_04590 [Nitrosopumilus sp.]|nr:hypothetical protein [Nitrosopumilus sp.]MDH5658600.1 hypothetical protein [Nitrosopumilus sp.]
MRTRTNNKKMMIQVLGNCASKAGLAIVVLILTIIETKGGET